MCSGHSRRGYGAPGLRAALKPPAAPCDSPYHFVPGVFKPRENLLVRHPAAASRRTERPQVLTVLWLRKLILRFCTSTDGEVADAFTRIVRRKGAFASGREVLCGHLRFAELGGPLATCYKWR